MIFRSSASLFHYGNAASLRIHLGVVCQELRQTDVGQRVFQQTLDRRKRAGRHVGPRLDTLDDVLRMPNRSRQHLRIITVVTIHTHDLGDESHPVLANIVQTAYERRHIRRTGLAASRA